MKKSIKQETKKTYAQVYAEQRRIKALSKDEGLTLVELLKKAGLRFHLAENPQAKIITIGDAKFVVDLTT